MAWGVNSIRLIVWVCGCVLCAARGSDGSCAHVLRVLHVCMLQMTPDTSVALLITSHHERMRGHAGGQLRSVAIRQLVCSTDPPLRVATKLLGTAIRHHGTSRYDEGVRDF